MRWVIIPVSVAVLILAGAGASSGTVTDPGIGGVETLIGATDGLDALSGDGRYVAFWSPNELTGAESVGSNDRDAFVYDRQTETFVRASVSSAEVEADGESIHASISRDGGFVAFVSSATNLVAGDANSAPDVFVRDLVGGTTERVSLDSSDAEIDTGVGGQWGVESAAFISGDGDHVLFSSSDGSVVPGDANGTHDVFVRDLAAGTTVAVSVGESGDLGNAASQASGISSDGRHVLLRSMADNLVSGDSAGSSDAFLHDRDADDDGIYDESGPGATSIQRVNLDPSGALTAPTFLDLSGDGRHVAIMNGSGVFVRDLGTETTAQVDVAGNADPADGSPYYGVSISDDGRVVAFWTGATNLIGPSGGLAVHDRDSDDNGTFDEPGGMANDGELSAGLFPSVSGDGRVVFDYYTGTILERDAVEPPDPGTLVVNKVADTDDGDCTALHCTLREAINAANAEIGPNTITFDFDDPADTAAPFTIQPAAALPTITDPVVIDGTTEPGFSGEPIVELDGSAAGGPFTHGLHITGGDSTVRGLIINRFTGNGINLATSGDNTVAGNYIGTNAAGNAAAGNGGIGVLVGFTSGNTIGGATPASRNVVSGNASTGVEIRGSSGNTVAGNIIGLDESGTARIGNGLDGIRLDSTSSNTIGGAAAGAGNLVSGNAFREIYVVSGGSNVIAGNLVGTNLTGSAGLDAPGGYEGVYIAHSTNNTVGGTTVGARNVISGNSFNGVAIRGATSTGNVVQGNYIGLNAAGSGAVANSGGVEVGEGSGNTIGGTDEAARNVISGNTTNGISLVFGATGTLIQGNYIGTDASGTSALGNGNSGLQIASSGNTVGGTDSGAGNRIANNAVNGVWVTVSTASGNRILGNSVYANGALGIDLGLPAGVTANDSPPGDADAGANNLQNFPELTSVTAGAPGAIEGTLDSGAGTFRIEFFSNAACDGSGHGEGATYLGFVETDANTPFSFDTALAEGDIVTATATAPGGSTSELSSCVEAEPFAATPSWIVNTTADTDDGACTTTHCSLREAINRANAEAGLNTVGFAIPGSGPHTIQPASALPTITDPVVIDGASEPDYAGTPVVELDGQNAGANVAGLHVQASGSTVRGLVINRFSYYGIWLQECVSCPDPGGNVVEGNYLGTDVTGTLDRGNIGGVLIAFEPDDTIGGTEPEARNLISGNTFGVTITGAEATGSLVVGNYIGTDVTGALDLGNTSGVSVGSGAAGTTIGQPGAPNVISGNDGSGVGLAATTGAVVQGNLIGTQADGTGALGNGLDGVRITGGSDNVIGGTAAGAGNTIAFNGSDGVWLSGGAGSGNSVLGNSIFANTQLGIDLAPDGVTTNDGGDGDPGPNDLQNFPELTSAEAGGGSTVVEGTLDAVTHVDPYRVEFFSGASCDASGNGEGQTYLGFEDVVVGGGPASFDTTFPLEVTVGHVITATATAPDGSTSEFSACRVVAAALPPDTPSWTVNSPADTDDGACTTDNCTLREAINRANNVAGTDTIGFDIAGAGPHTIQPANDLPALTAPVVIDGTTEPDFDVCAAGPVVEIDGRNAVNAALRIYGGSSTVRGLVINRAAVKLDLRGGGGGNTVECNYIGTDVTGATALGGSLGIWVQSSDNTIGGTAPDAGNLISGNGMGMQISPFGAGSSITGTIVQGNLIGTDRTGTLDVGNTGSGIHVYGVPSGAGSVTETQIGGTAPGARNVISGNGRGVALTGSGAQVLGNYIGTDITGTEALGNTESGVRLEPDSNGDSIGGGDPGEPNVISGNGDGSSAGILVLGGDNSSIVGNLIGTDASGSAALGNNGHGILLQGGAEGHHIAGNVVSGNDGDGIQLRDAGTVGNVLGRNLIGVGADGVGALGNGRDGVRVENGAASVEIGGEATDQVIAHNAGDGVRVGPPGASSGVLVRGNQIFGNGGLGIDLGPDGVTANDADDTDAGVNDLQNFPVITSATVSGGSTTFEGTLDSLPSTNYVVEVFANDSCDPSGHGEGQSLATGTSFTTDGNGDFSFSLDTSESFLGKFVTATATVTSTGSTSELSECVEVVEAAQTADVSVAKADSADPVSAGAQLTYTLTVDNAGPAAAADVEVTDTLPAGVTFVSASAGGSESGGVVTWNLGTIAASGPPIELTLVVAVDEGQAADLSNTAVITTATGDSDDANDSDTETTGVEDTTPPVIEPPADPPATEATGPGGAIVTYTPPTADDAVDGTVTVTCVPPSGSLFPVGETEVECTAVDGAGNESTTTFTITIEDTTAPVIEPPADPATVEATEAGGAIVYYPLPAATDGVDGAVTVTCVPPPGSLFPVGETEVECTAVDGAGNESTTTFTITIEDTTAPVIEPPADPPAVSATAPGGAVVDYTPPLATDGVDGSVEVTCEPPSGSLFPPGATLVECTATDQAGNSSTASFTVRVNSSTGEIIPTLDPLLPPEPGIWSWGHGAYGRLGSGAHASRHIPGAVVGVNEAEMLAAGSAHGLALTPAGTVESWGDNWQGALGADPSDTQCSPYGDSYPYVYTVPCRTTPSSVGGISGVDAVAAGGSHTLALRDGEVYSWGGNAYGQLGVEPTDTACTVPYTSGSTTYSYTQVCRPTPQPVPGLSGIVAVAAGGRHSLALGADGHVRAWGANDAGQLGVEPATTSCTVDYTYDSTTYTYTSNCRSEPEQVAGLEGIVAIAAGSDFSLALDADGRVYSWGNNYDGQLGVEPTDTACERSYASAEYSWTYTLPCRSTPAPVSGLTDVTRIAAGWRHGLALTGDGAVYAWGANTNGELGVDLPSTSCTATYAYDYDSNGTPYSYTYSNTNPCSGTPVQVTGVTDVSEIAAGYSHSLALAAGDVYAWGANWSGELGAARSNTPCGEITYGYEYEYNGTTSTYDYTYTQYGCQPTAEPIEGLTDVGEIAAGYSTSFATGTASPNLGVKSFTTTLPPGASVTSDVEQDGATADDPVEVSVQSPSGGEVSVSKSADSAWVGDFNVLGRTIEIEAPDAASADEPIVLTFVVDESLFPASYDVSWLYVYRNGLWVQDCTGAGATPDPCVASRERLADGDVRVVVRTTDASEWTVGVAGPTAEAGGPYEVDEGTTVELDASGSAGGQTPLSFLWSPTAGLDDIGSATPSLDALDDSVLQVDLTVTDAVGLFDTDVAQVIVQNVAPTATLEHDAPLVAGETFELSLVDPEDPSPVDAAAGFEYAFDCGNGSGFTAFGANSAVTCTAATAGARTIRGKIRDKDGGVSEKQVDVVVAPAANPCAGPAPAGAIVGGAGNTTINGTQGNDVIFDLSGNNTINGRGGNDLICTGPGNDKVDGGPGNDTVSDTGGKNDVKGGDGNDTLTTGAGEDTVDGGSGDDTVNAGEAKNTVKGGDGADSITTGAGNDTVEGGTGDDTIGAGEGRNTVKGGDGKDVVTTGAGDDTIEGGGGDDTVNAGAGGNTVKGGDGRDGVTTGDGNDTVEGGSGDDTLNAGNGKNIVKGDDGADSITTGSGNDTIDGGRGFDTCSPGVGNNSVRNCEQIL